jgi:hypothetical protein
MVGRCEALGADELRLGNDDVLGHRRPESRGALLSRVPGPRLARVATRDPARRSADGRIAATASTALPLQHAARDFRDDAHATSTRRIAR